MTWTSDRETLLEHLKSVQQELRPPKRRNHDIETLRSLTGQLQLLFAEFAERVPRVLIGRCPICGHGLEFPIDLEGLDSPWWWDLFPQPFSAPHACEHFQLLLGAVDLRGRQPVEVDTWSAIVGPGAPFIIRRLLEMDGVKAVISRFTLGTGDIAYPISYFSEAPIPQTDLHQEWRMQSWMIKNADGAPVGHEIANDPWEFDLEEWFDKEKLYWTEPGDQEMTLKTGRPNPFEGASGTRQKQIVGSGKVKLSGAPDGSDDEYYAPY